MLSLEPPGIWLLRSTFWLGFSLIYFLIDSFSFLLADLAYRLTFFSGGFAAFCRYGRGFYSFLFETHNSYSFYILGGTSSNHFSSCRQYHMRRALDFFSPYLNPFGNPVFGMTKQIQSPIYGFSKFVSMISWALLL